MGIMHNHGPIRITRPAISILDIEQEERENIRFYFDGLIVNFHNSVTPAIMDQIGAMAVGQANGTIVTTVTFESSWQLENLLRAVAESEYEFPGGIARAEGA